jgi:lysyl-tRNA synthetase class 2
MYGTCKGSNTVTLVPTNRELCTWQQPLLLLAMKRTLSLSRAARRPACPRLPRPPLPAAATARLSPHDSPAPTVGRGRALSSASGASGAAGAGVLKEQEIRLQKLVEMRQLGEEPYAYRFDATCSAKQLHTDYAALLDGAEDDSGTVVHFAGRVISKRFFGKKLGFLSVQDDTGRIQLYIEKANIGDERFKRLKDFLDVGDHIGASGPMKKTNIGAISVKVTDWRMLSKALLPLPDKFHGLVDIERRYRHRHVDMVMNAAVRDVFRARAMVMRRIRTLLDERGFLEVDTPVLASCAGGADAAPFLTHHNSLDIDLSLRIATELHLKRLVVGGLDRVYEIGRIFRNEGLSTRHNPEFTTVELYQAYADYRDMMDVTEDIFRDIFTHYYDSKVASAVIDTDTNTDTNTAISSNTGDSNALQIVYQGTPLDMSFPWRRITMDDMVKEVTGIDFTLFYSNSDTSGARAAALKAGVPERDLYSAGSIGECMNLVFEHVCESTIVNPTFVTDHPVEISPLARTHRTRGPLFTERFELFILGREYANAFSELTDAQDQRRRFEAQLEGAEGTGRGVYGICHILYMVYMVYG